MTLFPYTTLFRSNYLVDLFSRLCLACQVLLVEGASIHLHFLYAFTSFPFPLFPVDGTLWEGCKNFLFLIFYFFFFIFFLFKRMHGWQQLFLLAEILSFFSLLFFFLPLFFPSTNRRQPKVKNEFRLEVWKCTITKESMSFLSLYFCHNGRQQKKITAPIFLFCLSSFSPVLLLSSFFFLFCSYFSRNSY